MAQTSRRARQRREKRAPILDFDDFQEPSQCCDDSLGSG